VAGKIHMVIIREEEQQERGVELIKQKKEVDLWRERNTRSRKDWITSRMAGEVAILFRIT